MLVAGVRAVVATPLRWRWASDARMCSKPLSPEPEGPHGIALFPCLVRELRPARRFLRPMAGALPCARACGNRKSLIRFASSANTRMCDGQLVTVCCYLVVLTMGVELSGRRTRLPPSPMDCSVS